MNYAELESSDGEDNAYDLATQQGTQVEVAPILDRVVLRSSLFQILQMHCCTFTWFYPHVLPSV
jgi:hypothetical protein